MFVFVYFLPTEQQQRWKMKPYLCMFVYVNMDFWIPEMQSLCEIYQIPFEYDKESVDTGSHPFAIFFFPSDEVAKKIAARSVTLK